MEPASRTPDSSGADEPTRVSEAGPSSDSNILPLGPSIEGYLLKEEIHRGGQGVVYRAIQLGTKRHVALKVLLEGPFAGETTRRRFEREIELAASLRHPNIVTILDSGLSLGRYYFAMEYIDGVRLDRYLAKKRCNLDETLRLFEKICLAINFAHQRGVIHRDLKPPNILVDNDGEPHILDFGLAKPLHALAGSESTVQVLSTSGQLLGTVAYMSPEQASGHPDVDVRTDVFSLGVIFYEALVGQPPYPVTGPLGEILSRIATQEPANPRALGRSSLSNVRVDDEVATILLKALEKEPQRRYQTAGDLARDIRHRLNGEPIEAKRASGLYMLKKTLRRYRLQTAMAGVILAMLIGFLITFAVLFTGEREARRRADEKTEEARQAVQSQQTALQEARERTVDAVYAQQQLRAALVRQHIQRGDLALERADLNEARDSYWTALDVAPGPAAIWALRRYYLQTGDNGSVLLALAPHGPTALSPNGQLAAICTGPQSICVREVDSGRPVGWVCTPGPVTHVDVRDDGALAAAGPGWARAWRAGTLRPSVAVTLPEPGWMGVTPTRANGAPDETGPAAVCAVDAGETLLVVQPRQVRLYQGPAGEVVRHVGLRGHVIGRTDYDPPTRRLALPTSAGVELLTLEGEPLHAELVWTTEADTGATVASAVRAVRFADDGRLAVLADAVYVDSLTGTKRATSAPAGRAGAWTRLVEAAPEWELFDVRFGGTADAATNIVLGSRDGRLARYHNDQAAGSWRCTHDGLKELRLADEPGQTVDEGETQVQQHVVTVDGRETVTHWVGPERDWQRREVYNTPPAAWAASADGSTVLLAATDGRVVAYRPEQSRTPRIVLRPRMLAKLRGGSADEVSLAVSADGQRTVIRDGMTLRLLEAGARQMRTVPWAHPILTEPDKVVISHDGQLVALLARSPLGERQRIALLEWQPGGAPLARFFSSEDEPAAPLPPTPGAGRNPRARPLAGTAIEPFDFVGAVIREMAFVPRTHNILVARSNGQLLLLDPGQPQRPSATAPAAGPTSGFKLWLQLDSPATLLAFNRTGEYLALACEDEVVRLVSMARGEIRQRIPIGAAVSALAFNPRDDVLLVRTVEGTVRLFDPATAERIAEWPLPANSARPLAVWIGGRDALLLGAGTGVYEYQYEQTDSLIERNRAYARQRQITRALAGEDFAGAWTSAVKLAESDPELGRATAIAIVESALRRPNLTISPAWTSAVLAEATAATYLRLGQAAYDGDRFDLAREWLSRGRESAGDDLDAATLRRMAECDYLAGACDTAAEGLAAALSQADFDPVVAPTAALERVAALVCGGHLAEARQAAGRIGEPDPWGRYGDIVATTSARIVARYIAGLEDENLMSAGLDRLLGAFAERSLLFRDDVFFFAGELALQRGDRTSAAVLYQRCIDLARDPWPSNWSRWRLAHIARESPPTRAREGAQP